MTTTDPNTCPDCGHPKANHSDFSGCLVNVATEGMTFCDCSARFPDVKTLAPQPDVARTIPSRRSDPGTSHAADHAIVVKAGTQRAKLLLSFLAMSELTGPDMDPGLTDEEAMEKSEGVSPTSEYAKRCSELRDAGLIEPTGETRKGAAGVDRIVSTITDQGRATAQGLASA